MKQRSIIANGVIISAYKLAINLMLKLMHVTRLSHPLSDVKFDLEKDSISTQHYGIGLKEVW